MEQSTQAVAALQAEINRLRHELQTLQVDQKSTDADETIFIADYLLERLAQVGVTHMFGVPGDFNLGFLDYVEDHPKIEWAGNCNELNASYAADGYARIKEGTPGVILTTFGVGELSCTNGIAGAFSEHVPVVHIVGVPSTVQQKNKPMLHHTLGDGRYEAYYKISSEITISQTLLSSKTSAASEIDRILTECLVRAHPVYIMLPTDIVHEKIPSTRLKTPLNLNPPENEPEIENFVLNEIVELVEDATNKGEVVVLVDACSIRHSVKREVDELVKKTGFPVFAAPMGKTAVDETYERYGGIYVGEISRPEVRQVIENAQLILYVGALKSDFNTGNFSYHVTKNRTVEFHSDHTQVQFASYHGIGMKHLLPKLTARLHAAQQGVTLTAIPRFVTPIPEDSSPTITHAWFWPRMAEFFQSKDVVVAETGTSAFGILDVPLPPACIFVAQILWGSIGWSVGSTLGAAVAARARGGGYGRTVLFVGDGSLQLTVQELSVMMKLGVKPIIFVLNNKGYTIERYLHGEKRKYNDITNWKWTSLLEVLGGIVGETCQSYTVHNKDEIDTLLREQAFAQAEKIQLVEVMMEQLDAPRALKVQAEMSGKTNAYIAQVKATA